MAKDKANAMKKVNKPIIKALRFFLSVVSILVLGYIILNYVPFIAKYDHYTIASGSMDPVIKVGDLVIVDSSVDLDELEVGQIIAIDPGIDINSDGVNDVIVHYLYSINDVDGQRVYQTKPEISTQIDPWELSDDDILGLHVLTINRIGSFLMFAQSTIGRIILIVDLVVIYLIFEMFSDSKKKKEKEEKKGIESEESM